MNYSRKLQVPLRIYAIFKVFFNFFYLVVGQNYHFQPFSDHFITTLYLSNFVVKMTFSTFGGEASFLLFEKGQVLFVISNIDRSVYGDNMNALLSVFHLVSS